MANRDEKEGSKAVSNLLARKESERASREAKKAKERTERIHQERISKGKEPIREVDSFSDFGSLDFFSKNRVLALYCEAMFTITLASSMSGKTFAANFRSLWLYLGNFAFVGLVSVVKSMECSIKSVALISRTDFAKQSLYVNSSLLTRLR